MKTKTDELITEYFNNPLDVKNLTASRAKVRAGVLYTQSLASYGKPTHPWRLAAFVWKGVRVVDSSNAALQSHHLSEGAKGQVPEFRMYFGCQPNTDKLNLPPKCRANDPSLCIEPALDIITERLSFLESGSDHAQITWELMITALAYEIWGRTAKNNAEIDRLERACQDRIAVLETMKSFGVSEEGLETWRDINWTNPQYSLHHDIRTRSVNALNFQDYRKYNKTRSAMIEKFKPCQYNYSTCPKLFLRDEKDAAAAVSFIESLGYTVPNVFGTPVSNLDDNIAHLSTMRDVAINTALNPHLLNDPEGEPVEKAPERPRLF